MQTATKKRTAKIASANAKRATAPATGDGELLFVQGDSPEAGAIVVGTPCLFDGGGEVGVILGVYGDGVLSAFICNEVLTTDGKGGVHAVSAYNVRVPNKALAAKIAAAKMKINERRVIDNGDGTVTIIGPSAMVTLSPGAVVEYSTADNGVTYTECKILSVRLDGAEVDRGEDGVVFAPWAQIGVMCR
jgi:hypothetical protein